jgi:hypothetical protein
MIQIFDKELYRGDANAQELKYLVKGKHDDRIVRFVAKKDRQISSTRLIDKINVIGGGSDDQVKVEYGVLGSDTSLITVTIEKYDTQDLTLDTLQIDCTSTNAGDSEDHFTIFTGKIEITEDVQTPFDISELPGQSVRVLVDNNLRGVELIPKKFYEALISASGNVISASTENFDDLVTVTKTAAGTYTITSDGAEFVSGKTEIKTATVDNYLGTITNEFTGTNTIKIRSYSGDGVTGSLFDRAFVIQIKIYN